MSDETQGERRWIVEPQPAPGEVALYMAFGDDVELNDEQQAALSALLRVLEDHDAEVAGYQDPACPKDEVTWCKPLQCTRVKCTDLICMPLSSGLSSVQATSWNLMGSFGTGPR